MISITPIQSPMDGEVLYIQILIDKNSLIAFKQLVNRAMNTWDRAPAELKVFADMITEGKVLQDYKSQK